MSEKKTPPPIEPKILMGVAILVHLTNLDLYEVSQNFCASQKIAQASQTSALPFLSLSLTKCIISNDARIIKLEIVYP